MKSNDASSKDDNTPPLMVPRRQQEPPQTFKKSPTVSISRITLETNKKNIEEQEKSLELQREEEKIKMATVFNTRRLIKQNNNYLAISQH
jgi:hypothetical protein